MLVEGRGPLAGDTAEQSRIDDQFAEGINRAHVKRGQAADPASWTAKEKRWPVVVSTQ